MGKKEKPVTVKIDDFRRELNNTVAKSELPAFLIEMIIGEFLAGVSQVARKEYKADREKWEYSKSEVE